MSNETNQLDGVDAVEVPSEIKTNKMLAAALWYAVRGWRVFPLRTGDKTPIHSGGFHNATCDETIIRNWWASYPNANVGIATGAENRLLVLDNDAYKGGQDTLDALTAEHGDLPQTVEVKTGGGGSQYYFSYPSDGVKYRNKSYSKKLWPFVGLDVRGDGGYVVAPPSIHPSGRAYVFEASSQPNNVPLADAPQWLLALISGDIAANTQDADADADALNGVCDTLPSIPKATIEVPKNDKDRYRRHLQKRAAEYLKTSEAAVQGQGGDAHTFHVAGHILSLECGGERLSVGEVISAMGEWNGRCSPPWDVAGLTSKVTSAASNGTARGVKACKACGAEKLDGWGDGVVGANATSNAKIYSPSNVGNGQLFSDTYRNELMYVSEWKRWLRWDGKRWEAVTAEVIRRHAHRLVMEVMPTIAKGITSDDDRAKYFKHIALSHQTFQLDAMLKEATAYINVKASILDANAMLFNLQNGTLDCQTGEVRPHRRDDFITKVSPCSFDPTATALTWGKFLKRILTDDEIISYLQTAVGYSLTGSVREECLFVLWGSGANGKSTFIETMLYCLGDYGQAMSPSVLLADNRQGGNSDDVARLQGVRCATTVETRKGGSFNEEKVKALTGGDRIPACRKYEHPFEFDPTHKIWLATNYKPNVAAADDGIWRRMRLVPFTAAISDAEKDMTLKGKGGKLAAEADGIMAWMIQGLKRWISNGLPIPNAVKSATADYREESDIFGQFLSSECVMEVDATAKSSDLFNAYKRWADDNGMSHPMTAMSMAKCLKERGYQQGHTRKGNLWKGIGIAGDIVSDNATDNVASDDRAF